LAPPTDDKKEVEFKKAQNKIGMGINRALPPKSPGFPPIRTAYRHRLAKVLACPRGPSRGRLNGETAMAKVLDELERGCKPLSLSLRPDPLALADRDRRANLEPRDVTAWFLGDPLPGMSALDRRLLS
jgi:hypothetical protein